MNPNAFSQQFPPALPQAHAGVPPQATMNPMQQSPMSSQPGINPQMLASKPPFPPQQGQMQHQMQPQLHNQPMQILNQHQNPSYGQNQIIATAISSMGMSMDQFNSLPQVQKQQFYTKALQSSRQPPPSAQYPQMTNFDPHSANFMNHDRQPNAMAPARPGTPGMASNPQSMVPPPRPGTSQGHRPPMQGPTPMNMHTMSRLPAQAMPMSANSSASIGAPNPMAMNMNGINGMAAPNMAMNGMPMVRPPSRSSSTGLNMGHPPNMNLAEFSNQRHVLNGAPTARLGPQTSPTHPSIFPGGVPTPSQPHIPTHPPLDHASPRRSATPNSPYRNAQPKLPGELPQQSPRAPSTSLPMTQPAITPSLPGSSMGGMGPPNIPRSASTSTETSYGSHPHLQRRTQSPRPPSSHGMSSGQQNLSNSPFQPAQMDPLASPFPIVSQSNGSNISTPGGASSSSANLPDHPESGTHQVALNGLKESSDPGGLGSSSHAPPKGVVTDTKGIAPAAASQMLPKELKLDPSITRFDIVPLAASDKTIPPLTDAEISDAQTWMKNDKAYLALYQTRRKSIGAEDNKIMTAGRWWERAGDPLFGASELKSRREHFKVRYPTQPKPAKRKGFKLPRTVDPVLVDRPEQLVPIRLEFDVDAQKMRDTFLWNINDPVITAEDFAQSVVDDYSLPHHYLGLITKSIQDQLSDFQAHSSDPFQGIDGTENTSLFQGALCDKDNVWWESWRKRLKTPGGFLKSGYRQHDNRKTRKRRRVVLDETEDKGFLADLDDDRIMTVDDFEDDEEPREDMRILVKLDIIVSRMKLDDQFEWDLDNPGASPEDFAEVYCQELGLAGEFKTAVSHSIREQIFAHKKSLFLVGHPSDGTAIQDEELRASFLPALSSGSRTMDQVASFTPILSYMSDGDLDRSEKDREKDMNKRRKRNTRARRGVAMPDREPIRTCRTPANGFPEIDPATVAPTTTMPGRRAAAAAATLNIANMVASENSDIMDSPVDRPKPLPTLTPVAVAPPVAAPPKEKKPKSLIQPPKIPASLLRPRAALPAPTPSTAADTSLLPQPLENDPPPSPPLVAESRAPRIVSAKRAKELAREAKEKEFVEGQHANYHDGIWHCSNCGCPESIAVGRRKGPLGDQSQCGPCGKFWHGHKRPKPIEYNRTLEYHLSLQRQAQSPTKRPRKKAKGGAYVDLTDALTPNNKARMDSEDIYTPGASTIHDDDRAISPVSSVSSTSEKPLSQQVKANGTHPSSESRSSVEPSVTSNSGSSAPPPWLQTAVDELRQKYTNDRFEVIQRKAGNVATSEWRLKCLDCPGKLYTPGPGETLGNYDIHLKNRAHRKAVMERMSGRNPSTIDGAN